MPTARHIPAFALALMLAAALSFPGKASAAWISGYYAGYTYSNGYTPSLINYSLLTHVMMFAVRPNSDGSLNTTLWIDSVTGPAVAKDVAKRAHAAGKKAIIVFGGDGASAGFPSAMSAQYRAAFEQNILGLVDSWGYDGVDFDIEPLPSTSYTDYATLLSDLRAARPNMLIMMDTGWRNNSIPLTSAEVALYRQIAPLLDQLNVRTYGMAGAWSGWVSWHSSAVVGAGSNHPSSVETSIDQFAAAGIPLDKLGMGIGFYGSCWSAPVTAPLMSLGTSKVIAADNAMSYTAIMHQYYSAANYHYDTTAQAPYLGFQSAVGPGCTFISYEDPTSIAAKGAYARQRGIGGTIIWQLAEGYDPAAADPDALLRTVYQAFAGTASAPPPAPTAALSATPASITAGQSATLAWSSTNATSCTGTGFSTGSAGSGSVSVSPAQTTTYAVTCTGGSGSASASTTVSVASASDTQAPATAITAPLDGATVAGTVTIQASASDNTAVAKVEFYRDGVLIGSDTTAPYAFSWDTAADSNAAHTLQTKAYDAAGNTGVSPNVSVTVNNAAPAPAAFLAASPTSITAGQSATLTWSSANATSCAGSGFSTGGAIAGSVFVSPAVTTAYSLVCTGTGGTSPAASATVTVSSVAPAIGIGARVVATAPLNVRTKANTRSGKIRCTQPVGSMGTIVDGPSSAQGYTWWKVNWDTGCDGWSVDDYLAAASAQSVIAHTLAQTWTGGEVRVLQSILGSFGYYRGDVTGYFGSATADALRSFQADHNLAATGIVGPRTRALFGTLAF